MKRIFLPLVVVLCATVANAQEESEAGYVSLPDSVMRQVVERVVVDHFKKERSGVAYFSEHNIKPEWLPKLDRIRFVFVDKAEGKVVHFFKKARRVGKDYTIDFGWGDPDCNAVGDTWGFRVTGDSVRDVKWNGGGWGTGCGASAGLFPSVSSHSIQRDDIGF